MGPISEERGFYIEMGGVYTRDVSVPDPVKPTLNIQAWNCMHFSRSSRNKMTQGHLPGFRPVWSIATREHLIIWNLDKGTQTDHRVSQYH